jgi:hypothetical protein
VSETNAIDENCEQAKNDLFSAVINGSVLVLRSNQNGNFPFVRYRLYPSKNHDPKNHLEGIYRLVILHVLLALLAFIVLPS